MNREASRDVEAISIIVSLLDAEKLLNIVLT